MPSAKEIQKACKNKSTSKGRYAGAIAQFLLWWDGRVERLLSKPDAAQPKQGVPTYLYRLCCSASAAQEEKGELGKNAGRQYWQKGGYEQ